MEIIPFPRVAFGTPFAKPFSGDGDKPVDYEGYPLNLDLKSKKTLKNYTLFGNTSEDAKGVGDWDGEKFVAPIRVEGVDILPISGWTANYCYTKNRDISSLVALTGVNASAPINVEAYRGKEIEVDLPSSTSATAQAGSFFFNEDGTQIIGSGVSFYYHTDAESYKAVRLLVPDNATYLGISWRVSLYPETEYKPKAIMGETLYPSVLSSPLHKIGDIVDYKESNGKEWHALRQIKIKDMGTWKYEATNKFFYINTADTTALWGRLISPETQAGTFVLRSSVYTYGGVATDVEMSTKPKGVYAVGQIKVKDADYTDVASFLAGVGEGIMVFVPTTPTEVQGEPLPRLAIPRGTSQISLATDVQPSNIKATINLPKPNTDIYGVVHHYELSSPTLVRVGKMSLHKSLPVQSRMRRCVLDDSGKVVYYLHPDNSLLKADGTPARLDGTDGMVMVEIPEHWRKCTDNTTDKTYTVEISLKEFPGAHKVNKCYYSAYEATVERGVNKLASVCSTDVKYRGGNNQSAWDGTYRSVLGKPATAISLTNGRTYAHNRGAGWQQGEWDIYNSICWLYYIEYASLYAQLAFNSTLTAEGYRQGGLGAGVTNADGTKWNNYNGYYPFINCGHTNSLGNKTGIVPFSWNEEQAAAYGGALTTNVPSYRGIENPFGHIWKWHDGFLAKGDGTKQEYFLCHDRSRYASALNDAYQSHGLSAGANNYVKEFIRDGLGNILCKSVGGGSTTYMTDYHYEAFTSGTIYALYSGGGASYGANAGFACLYSLNGPAYPAALIGLRLCWSKFNEITK